jgi:catechol 2,3-dioxygenase
MSAGGYHHHVGVNTWAAGASPASADDAKLVEWELILPNQGSVKSAGESIATAGYPVNADGDTMLARDDWGIAVRIRPEG